jgi:HEAT repeat protein
MDSLAPLIDDLLSSDETRAEAAVLRLAAQGDRALPALERLLGSPSPDVRWWAVRAVAAIPSTHSAEIMARMLPDDDPAVQQAAALGLRHHPSPDAVPALVSLLGDSQALTRQLASDALAAVGPEAIDRLRAALQGDNPTVRVQAARALALMKHPAAIGPLFELLDDPSALVAYWAERGLDDLGVGMVFFPA